MFADYAHNLYRSGFETNSSTIGTLTQGCQNHLWDVTVYGRRFRLMRIGDVRYDDVDLPGVDQIGESSSEFFEQGMF